MGFTNKQKNRSVPAPINAEDSPIDAVKSQCHTISLPIDSVTVLMTGVDAPMNAEVYKTDAANFLMNTEIAQMTGVTAQMTGVGSQMIRLTEQLTCKTPK